MANRFSPAVLPRRRASIFDVFNRGIETFEQTRRGRESDQFLRESRGRQAEREEFEQGTRELGRDVSEASAFRAGVRMPGVTQLDEGTALPVVAEGPGSELPETPTLSARDVFAGAAEEGPSTPREPVDQLVPGSFRRQAGEFTPGIGKVRLPSGAIIDAETADDRLSRIRDEEFARTAAATTAERGRRERNLVGAGVSPQQAPAAVDLGGVPRRTAEGEVDIFGPFREPTRRQAAGITAGERQGLAEMEFLRLRQNGMEFDEALDRVSGRYPGSLSPSEARRVEDTGTKPTREFQERRDSIEASLRSAGVRLDTEIKQRAVDMLAGGSSKDQVLGQLRTALQAEGIPTARTEQEVADLQFVLDALPDEVLR